MTPLASITRRPAERFTSVRALIAAAIILSVVAVGGCGKSPAGSSAITPATSPSAQAGTPTPAATSSPTPSPAATDAPTPTPAATGTPTPSSGATTFQVLTKFSCRFPVRMLIDDWVKGFLDLNTGRFEPDPTAPAGGQSYSWFAHRWLPVAPELQSPDGTHYAYVAADGIHDVDLTTKVDRKLVSSTPNQIIEYGADGIYVTKYGAYSGHLGLWLLDPRTASLKQLLPVTVAFDSLGGGAAWYSDSRNDGGPSPDTLYRIELVTGSRTVWFQKPNVWAVHLGTDAAGKPLVGYLDVRTPDLVTLAVMSGPGQAHAIRTGPNETMPWILSVTDSHGMWFDSNSDVSSLWLMQADDHLVEVAKAPVRPLGACQ